MAFNPEDEFPDDEEEYEAPYVAPPKLGRNEPCWCGSGKKYKKCHLESDESDEHAPEGAGEPEGSSVEKRLLKDLVGNISELHSEADAEEACVLYFGQKLDELYPQPNEDALAGFMEWYMHDFRPRSKGRTLIEEYQRTRGPRLSSQQRALLECWRQARLSLWEVQEIRLGEGVELEDLLTGERIFVHDVTCSFSMVRWDCTLSRLYASEGRWYFSGIGYTIPRSLLSEFTARIEQESAKAGQSAAEFVRANGHLMLRMLDTVERERRDGLRIVTAEGHEVQFCAAEYRVEDEPALVAELERMKQLEPSSPDQGDPERDARMFAWLEAGESDSRRSLGQIVIGKGKLRLECLSRQRLAAGRQLLEQRCGKWLRHVIDSTLPMEEVKRRALNHGAVAKSKEEGDSASEDESQALLKMKAEHYSRWLDESIPALGGLTPRAAAKSATGRRTLEDLLRIMENSEERLWQQGEVAYDFSIVRKALGM